MCSLHDEVSVLSDFRSSSDLKNEYLIQIPEEDMS